MNSSSPIQTVDDLHPVAREVIETHPVLTDVQERITPDFANRLHDPFLFADMDIAVDRLVQAVTDGDRVVVFSDFDTDGIPAAAMWHDLFTTLEHDTFSVYIPKRDVEGFGLKTEQVEQFADDETDLIITTDCGIRSHEAVAAAREAGIDVIICDHHVPADTTPEANAIINPALPDSSYPFAGLAGAGVAWKLFQALAEDGRLTLPKNFTKGQLDLVAIATISDMVPLIDENQALARFGLRLLRNTKRPGLRALYEKGRIQGRELTAVDIGFTIGSHINAASRLDQPELAYKLLVTRNHKEGKKLAAALHKVYRKRKRRTASLKEEVAEVVSGAGDDPAVVQGSPDWKPALLGPVAHRITDAFHSPVFLWGQANGRVKGSARATQHNVVSMLQSVADDHLKAYGGHDLAGGFELAGIPSQEFTSALQKDVTRFQLEAVDEIQPVSATLSDFSWHLYQSLAALGPFGAGCPQPLFRITDVAVSSVRRFGSSDEHVSITVTNGNASQECVAFFATETMKQATPGASVSVVGALEKTTFGFKKKLRFRMESVQEQ